MISKIITLISSVEECDDFFDPEEELSVSFNACSMSVFNTVSIN